MKLISFSQEIRSIRQEISRKKIFGIPIQIYLISQLIELYKKSKQFLRFDNEFLEEIGSVSWV